MLRLGLTGGIASGKSTVALIMQEAGAIVLDADGIVHDLMARGGAAYDQVVAAFGKEILDAQGNIDRRRLGNQVFSDEKARLRLNEVVHPLVREELKAAEARYRQAETAQGRNWLLVMMIPLLFESKLTSYVDRTVLVYCPEQRQLERLMSRNGFSAAEAQMRIKAQLSIEAKVGLADEIIDNSRDLAWVRQEVNRVLGELIWDPYEPASSAAS
ncbi:MAG TPA: dephospho-CoA kinase [Candidatus Obscuribacterales bacterium]